MKMLADYQTHWAVVEYWMRYGGRVADDGTLIGAEDVYTPEDKLREEIANGYS